MATINTLNIFRKALIGFMLVAGVAHFLYPEQYYPLIPDYLAFPKLLNSLSGVLEISLGLLLITKKWRKLAAIGIIVLLVLFIPSHIHFIQLGTCIADGLCTPAWMAWVRLILIHPLLMLWAWKVRY